MITAINATLELSFSPGNSTEKLGCYMLLSQGSSFVRVVPNSTFQAETLGGRGQAPTPAAGSVGRVN